MKNFLPGLFKIVEGDATNPHGGNHRLIIHCCNNEGAWGSGFVLAISKRWKKPENEYRLWYRGQNKFQLGEIQVVDVQSDIAVVNMIAQEGYKKLGDAHDAPYIRYEALKTCLDKVAAVALERKSSIAAPRIGCGLAGGTWATVEKLLKETLIDRGINVTIYDLPK
jgi:O-acetyl-ADP-ribose deacetylase (regulator of RNase III)